MPADPFISAVDLADYRDQAVDIDKALIALDSACQIVREKVGQAVDLVEDDVVVLDSEGTDTLLLPELPVVSVSSVIGPAGVAMVEGTDYVLDKEMGALRAKRRGVRFLRGRGLYEVTYTHGWDSVPSSVRVVALTLAARIYDQQLVRQESVGGVFTMYAASESVILTPGEERVLAKHNPGRRRM